MKQRQQESKRPDAQGHGLNRSACRLHRILRQTTPRAAQQPEQAAQSMPVAAGTSGALHQQPKSCGAGRSRPALLALLSLCVIAVLCLPACGKAAQAAASAQSASPAPESTSASAEAEVQAAVQEPAVMKAYQLPEGFVYVDEVVPDVVLEIRYATAYNFTAAPIDGYEQPLAVLTTEAADALKTAAALAAQDGWRLHIYDAYRPKQALACISAWELTEDETAKADFYPNLAKSALFTDGYLSKYSLHTRGSTVDLTLEDKDGTLIDMGGTYDMLDQISNYDTPDITEEQRANRYYLRGIMEEAGFDTISTEWWHYQLRNEPYPDTYFDFPVA